MCVCVCFHSFYYDHVVMIIISSSSSSSSISPQCSPYLAEASQLSSLRRDREVLGFLGPGFLVVRVGVPLFASDEGTAHAARGAAR